MPEVVISATRTPMARQQVAASVDVVNAATVGLMGPQINLSEALQRVPGLAVLNRQNYAQDLQISSRGFGARSPFGVRGVRLYADGIPATMPDGQGQSALFDLGSAERIEVLRGPASALYGNASGGVVQVFTQDGPPTPEVKVGLAVGRDGLRRESFQWAGETGRLNHVLSLSHFETDGWRQHSAAQRDQLNAKLAWALGGGAKVSVVANYLNMPQVQDPLALDALGLQIDRHGVTVAGSAPGTTATPALTFNTRKRIENAQVGVIYELPLRGAKDALSLMVYTGTRQVQQFQAIPVAPQNGAAHPGGVIDFARAYGGLDARYTWRGALIDRALSLTGGINLDDMREDRQGYQNFVGSVTGIEGALKRNERNRARNSDQYLQGQWALGEAWDLGLGVRHSRVRFESRDHYIVTGNGDDSGALRFSATTPTASLMYKASQATNLYVSAGRSFETPTLGEVAYQSGSGTNTGWNLALQPSRGEHVEVGIKSRVVPGVQLNVAAFHVDTDDEIGVSSTGGRSVYRNVGRTERHGAEASAQWRISPQWQAYTALSWTNAHYQDASGSGTTAITPGHSLPGVPARQAYVELGWRPIAAWQTALELHHTGRMWADDANTAYAPASTLLAVRTAWRHLWGDGWALDATARVDNLMDQHAMGSVIVNDGNQRYYEPAPGRSLMLSLAVRRAY
jgi:iron complex outermembrane receptor protein